MKEEDKRIKEIVTPKPNTQPMTYSQIRSWEECPMKHFWQYKAGNGYGIQPVVTPVPFLEGDLLHYAIALWRKTKRMYRAHMVNRVSNKIQQYLEGKNFQPEVADKLEAKMYAMIGAALAYKTHYANDLKDNKFIGIEEEVEFTFAGLPMICKLDAVSRQDKALILWEEKSAATVDVDKYSGLPLDLQGLIYAEACKEKFGEYPAWIQFDFILKSKLRRRGGTKTQPERELLESYMTRVTQQYLKEPDKMFFRPPALPFNSKIHKAVMEDVTRQISLIRGTAPTYNYDSCLGKYGRACEFLPACTARLSGKKDGWNSGECKGMYVPKEVLHPEYLEKITEEDEEANADDTKVKKEGDTNVSEKES